MSKNKILKVNEIFAGLVGVYDFLQILVFIGLILVQAYLGDVFGRSPLLWNAAPSGLDQRNTNFLYVFGQKAVTDGSNKPKNISCNFSYIHIVSYDLKSNNKLLFFI